jgi:hypothetical protein
MRGLLPAQVLAPRNNRTGIMADYLQKAMRAAYPQLLHDLLAAPMLLAELGIIEPAALRRAAETCLAHSWDEQIAVALLFTLQTELWLRARRTDTVVQDDGHSLAVLSPGERPGSLNTEVQSVYQTEA